MGLKDLIKIAKDNDVDDFVIGSVDVDDKQVDIIIKIKKSVNIEDELLAGNISISGINKMSELLDNGNDTQSKIDKVLKKAGFTKDDENIPTDILMDAYVQAGIDIERLVDANKEYTISLLKTYVVLPDDYKDIEEFLEDITTSMKAKLIKEVMNRSSANANSFRSVE